jgi:hypothetical protein
MLNEHRVLARLVSKYVELCDVCYRVSVAAHDERGRFRKGHRARRTHPALLKKVDLDEALARVYRRFFSTNGTSTSTSNSRRQGKETRSSSTSDSRPGPSRSEKT